MMIDRAQCVSARQAHEGAWGEIAASGWLVGMIDVSGGNTKRSAWVVRNAWFRERLVSAVAAAALQPQARIGMGKGNDVRFAQFRTHASTNQHARSAPFPRGQ
uniref:Uncharacterized protein n=1 Tax=Plectus sambesii TaxID=2011161 RepID=A0A914UQ99_9BILA